ncbi:NACHT domain-containing protein [Methylobacterium sp. WSM2598]|uniref:NACHT domain-containing protein n=1 Tax=Methylobacterium sp. WSM2598 TaxID=398261 RepID=UPI00039C1205|nr:NACHT domain-containing protein [Methylobacterium sp. WSM2598]
MSIQDDSPIVGTVFARNAVVIRHANELHLSTSEEFKGEKIAWNNSADSLDFEALKRAILSGHENIKIGGWVIEAKSIGNLHISASSIAEPGRETVESAIRKILEELKCDKNLKSLQSYMAAMRMSCAKPPYLSLRHTDEVHNCYVNLPAQLPDGRVTSDALRQAGRWLCDNTIDSVYIEGNAGSGKTSTMLRLATVAMDAPESAELHTKYIPMFVKFRHLNRANGSSIEERLWNAVKSSNELDIQGEQPSPGFMAAWSHHMDGLPWLILLDGFDELNDSDRYKMRLWILDALRTHGNIKIVASTRQLTMIGQQLTDRGQARSIRLMNVDSNTLELLSNAILGEKSIQFNQQLHAKSLISVINNPLDLTICSLVYQAQGTIPSSRAEIINEFLDISIRESIYQDLHHEIDVDFTVPVLEAVGLTFFESRQGTYEEALDVVAEILGSDNSSIIGNVAEIRAKKILETLARRSGIFRIENELIVWAHVLFADFLAARAVARRLSSESQRAVKVATTWFDHENRNPLFFLLALWSDCKKFKLRKKGNDATNVIRSILLRDYEFEPQDANDVASSAASARAAIALSPAFLEGARASKDIEELVAHLVTGDQEPFIEYNACARIFSSEYDAVRAFSDLIRIPRFKIYFSDFFAHAVVWLRSADRRLAESGAFVLGTAGCAHELIEAASNSSCIDEEVVLAGARYLDRKLYAAELKEIETKLIARRSAVSA